MRIHRSELYHMRGSGVGAIFSQLFRRLLPFASSLARKAINSPTGAKIMQSAKRNALKAGLDVTRDALAGENLKQSVKRRVKEAGKSIVHDMGGKKGKKKGKKGKKKKKITQIKKSSFSSVQPNASNFVRKNNFFSEIGL